MLAIVGIMICILSKRSNYYQSKLTVERKRLCQLILIFSKFLRQMISFLILAIFNCFHTQITGSRLYWPHNFYKKWVQLQEISVLDVSRAIWDILIKLQVLFIWNMGIVIRLLRQKYIFSYSWKVCRAT